MKPEDRAFVEALREVLAETDDNGNPRRNGLHNNRERRLIAIIDSLEKGND